MRMYVLCVRVCVCSRERLLNWIVSEEMNAVLKQDTKHQSKDERFSQLVKQQRQPLNPAKNLTELTQQTPQRQGKSTTTSITERVRQQSWGG